MLLCCPAVSVVFCMFTGAPGSGGLVQDHGFKDCHIGKSGVPHVWQLT